MRFSNDTLSPLPSPASERGENWTQLCFIHPVSQEPCTAEEIHDHEQLQLTIKLQNQGHWTCINFSRKRKEIIKAFLQGADRISFRKKATKGKLLFWAGKQNNIIPKNNPFNFFLEDGFIRSIGLGAAGVKPNSLVFDDGGIYFDAHRPSRLEKLLNEKIFTAAECEIAELLMQLCIHQQITKYNLQSQEKILDLSHIKQKKILIPGQVPNDASIRTGTLSLKTNLELLFTVKKENPDAFVIYKPHPDIVSGCRNDPIKPEHYKRYADLYLDNVSITECYPVIDELHTLTSLCGFEALQRGIKVYTYGLPFYAGWGLTEDRHCCPRRTRTLTLHELVAGTLVNYPRYYDYESKSFTTPYYLIRKFIKEKNL